MDQVRTGRFIAARRKEKGLTQKQLAEKLGISDKTVSEWECGNGFPEISLLLPLCDELGITVNDLLSAELVPGEAYQEKAENNMVEMIKEREENRRHYMLLFALGGVSLISFLTLLFVACLPTGAVSLTLRLVILLIAFVIFAVGLLAVIEGQRKIGYYRCAGCSETFVPTFWAHAFGLNIVSKRLLKCPYCGKRSFCKKVMSKKPAGQEGD